MNLAPLLYLVRMVEQRLLHAYPELTDRVYIIPQSVWLPTSQAPAPIDKIEGFPNLLLPAGLRPVKDVFFLWEELVKMKETWPELTFSIIGASLDEAVLQEVKRREAEYDWFYYLKEVSLEQMIDVYAKFDIILNTSISEGQPTSLLEAMFVGKPVIARKIPGNKSIIEHWKTGLLFETATEFHQLLTELLLNNDLEATACQTGKRAGSTPSLHRTGNRSVFRRLSALFTEGAGESVIFVQGVLLYKQVIR